MDTQQESTNTNIERPDYELVQEREDSTVLTLYKQDIATVCPFQPLGYQQTKDGQTALIRFNCNTACPLAELTSDPESSQAILELHCGAGTITYGIAIRKPNNIKRIPMIIPPTNGQ